jgi:hypothetical protein
MSKELDSLRVDLERVIEEHEPEIAAAIGVAASVVPNPAIDALLMELDDVVGRLKTAARPAAPVSSPAADPAPDPVAPEPPA